MSELDPEALRKIVSDSGISYKENSRSWIFKCPRCAKKDKLYIQKSDGRFVCWVCRESSGFAGRPEYALAELLNAPIQGIRDLLYGEHVIVQGSKFIDIVLRDYFGPNDPLDDEIEVFRALAWPHDFYSIDDKKSGRGLAYLESRGISLDIAKIYGLRYCPTKRRVIFPISVGDRLYGWQERLIVPSRTWDEDQGIWFETPKILTSEDAPRDKVLMFGDRLTGSPHAVITEGPVDCIHSHLVGGNVASMGKAVSDTQIQLIRNSGVSKIYIGLDPDAVVEAYKLVSRFIDMECYLLQAPAPYKDLGEMPMEEVLELKAHAPRITRASLLVNLTI